MAVDLIQTSGGGNMFKMVFDGEKALETLLYIANRCPIKDIYHIIKIQFFADRKHLERNGRFITGDSYIAMKNGPVASNAYNFLKAARGESIYLPPKMIEAIRAALEVKEFSVKTKRSENSDYLSQSDIACLDEAIAENGNLSFAELNSKSHDRLWQEANRNDEICFDAFIEHSQNSEQLKSYSEVFNFDLERMERHLKAEAVTLPNNITTASDIKKWLSANG